MSDNLSRLMAEYTGLERRVRRATREICAPFCRACSKVCCRPDICRDVAESPFLAEVWAMSRPRARFTVSRGFLGRAGCRLEAGRPPVCYSFNCRAILEGQQSPDQEYALKAISELMVFVGRRALGSRHLVELIDGDQLARVKPQRVLARVRLAGELLETALIGHAQGVLDQDARDRLKVVIG